MHNAASDITNSQHITHTHTQNFSMFTTNIRTLLFFVSLDLSSARLPFYMLSESYYNVRSLLELLLLIPSLISVNVKESVTSVVEA